MASSKPVVIVQGSVRHLSGPIMVLHEHVRITFDVKTWVRQVVPLCRHHDESAQEHLFEDVRKVSVTISCDYRVAGTLSHRLLDHNLL